MRSSVQPAHLLVAGTLTVSLFGVACSGDEKPNIAAPMVTATPPTADVVMNDATTEVSATSTTDEGTDEASPTSVQRPVPAGVTIADPVASASAPVVVGVDDGFWMAVPGGSSLQWSTDGLAWEAAGTPHGLDGVSSIHAVGDHLLVTSYGTDGMQMMRSDDRGLAWRPVPQRPGPTSTSDYLKWSLSPEATAFDGERVVMVGRSMPNIDWQRAAMELYGVDHGRSTGYSSGGSTLSAYFEDGVEVTFDADDIGLSPDDAFTPRTRWTLTDDTWTVEQNWLDPMSVEQRMAMIATGPAGILHIDAPPPSVGGPAITTDDVDAWIWAVDSAWADVDLPDDFGAPDAIAGGAAGYTALTSTGVHTSSDGTIWEMAHPRGDARAGPGSAPSVLAAGRGGIAIVIRTDDGSAQLVATTNGVTWIETELQQADSHAVAVSGDRILVMPHTFSAAPDLPSDPGELRALIVESFTTVLDIPGEGDGVGAILDGEEAGCVADGVVSALGIERTRELGFGAFPWHTLGYAMSFPYETPDAATIVDVFRRCSPNWPLLLITTFTQGAEQMSRESAECVAEQFDPARLADIFVREIARDDMNDPQPEPPDYLPEAAAALEACLTPREMGAIDLS